MFSFRVLGEKKTICFSSPNFASTCNNTHNTTHKIVHGSHCFHWLNAHLLHYFHFTHNKRLSDMPHHQNAGNWELQESHTSIEGDPNPSSRGACCWWGMMSDLNRLCWFCGLCQRWAPAMSIRFSTILLLSFGQKLYHV